MLLAGTVVAACNFELADPEYIRWPESELLVYLTGAIAQIAALKPTLYYSYVPLGLAAGVVQTVPQEYSHLIDILYNLNSDGSPGDSISQGSFTAARALGQPSCAGTRDGRYVVRSYTIHPESDSSFFVDPAAPESSPTAAVMALVQLAPRPTTALTDAVVMANTTPEMYQEALKDWVLYRAFAKDTESSDSQARSQAHYRAFMQFLGVPPRDKNAVPVAASSRETVSGASTV